jgi:hypothetical protein
MVIALIDANVANMDAGLAYLVAPLLIAEHRVFTSDGGRVAS